ncbi:hypothetical protein CERSUDRAFT_74634 [Gelatoporia subvermispora B]|uniref:Uncharacterized protein n=1 Tax=Ceriporiopsis subvermispora (strain B) TaxID=914234 RepID=M2QUP8_CERS8|nr:hypothetical protein CERSUDRAFT_74634 [Gelatoporia subvermispora B]
MRPAPTRLRRPTKSSASTALLGHQHLQSHNLPVPTLPPRARPRPPPQGPPPLVPYASSRVSACCAPSLPRTRPAPSGPLCPLRLWSSPRLWSLHLVHSRKPRLPPCLPRLTPPTQPLTPSATPPRPCSEAPPLPTVRPHVPLGGVPPASRAECALASSSSSPARAPYRRRADHTRRTATAPAYTPRRSDRRVQRNVPNALSTGDNPPSHAAQAACRLRPNPLRRAHAPARMRRIAAARSAEDVRGRARRGGDGPGVGWVRAGSGVRQARVLKRVWQTGAFEGLCVSGSVGAGGGESVLGVRRAGGLIRACAGVRDAAQRFKIRDSRFTARGDHGSWAGTAQRDAGFGWHGSLLVSGTGWVHPRAAWAALGGFCSGLCA